MQRSLAGFSKVIRLPYEVSIPTLAFLLAALFVVGTPRTILNTGFQEHPLCLQLIALTVVMALLSPLEVLCRPLYGFHFAGFIAALGCLGNGSSLLLAIGVGALASFFLSLSTKLGSTTVISHLNRSIFPLTVSATICFSIGYLVQFLETRVCFDTVLATLLWATLNAVGIAATQSAGFISVNVEGEFVSVLASPDKFGGVFAFCFLAAAFVLGKLKGFSLHQYALLALLTTAYTTLRGVFVIGAQLTSSQFGGWWSDEFVLLTFLPLLLFSSFGLWISSSKPSVHPVSNDNLTNNTYSAARSTILVFAGFTFGMTWYWVDPGIEKNGTVMIDEFHSEWEWSEYELDTRDFGVRTVYSYSCMMEYLSHFFEVKRNHEAITAATLQGVSVLILKTPTKPYSDETIEAIREFVQLGGGVWLIGDHTNIFGMNTYLNQVANEYGFTFRADSVVDPDANRQLYMPEQGSHPIVQYLPLFLWYTGDQIETTTWRRDVILTSRLLVDEPDYSVNTFFGDFSPSLNERVGPVVQASAIPDGAGRVAAWSDSTLFSNFSFFLPGKSELALGYVDWLNRKNAMDSWRMVAIPIGAIVCLALFIRRCGEWHFDGFFLVLGFFCVVPLISLVNRTSYPELVPKVPLDKIAFLEPEQSEKHFPTHYAFDEPQSSHYLSAMLAAQRVGAHPEICETLEECLTARCVVWIRPSIKLGQSQKKKLDSYVRSGGQLLILDAGGGTRVAVEEVCHLFGVPLANYLKDSREYSRPQGLPLWMDRSLRVANESGQSSVFNNAGEPIGFDHPVWSIKSKSQTSLGFSAGVPVIGEFQFGKGRVVVCTTSSLFSDLSIGETSSVPDVTQLAALRVLFEVFKRE